AQRLAPDGQKIGEEFKVQFDPDNGAGPSVAMGPAGNFLIAAGEIDRTDFSTHVRARTYNEQGVADRNATSLPSPDAGSGRPVAAWISADTYVLSWFAY